MEVSCLRCRFLEVYPNAGLQGAKSVTLGSAFRGMGKVQVDLSVVGIKSAHADDLPLLAFVGDYLSEQVSFADFLCFHVDIYIVFRVTDQEKKEGRDKLPPGMLGSEKLFQFSHSAGVYFETLGLLQRAECTTDL